LQRALEAYERYLTQVDHYDLLSKGEKKLFERYSEDPERFTLATQNDPAARRSIKVARLREEKELKEKLNVRLMTILIDRLKRLTL
jgi:immunoglobulin-binding protein 1